MTDALTEFGESLKKNRKQLLFIGIVLLLLGSAGLFMNVVVTMATIMYIGFMLIFAGIVQIADLFRTDGGGWAKLWSGLLSLLYVADFRPLGHWHVCLNRIHHAGGSHDFNCHGRQGRRWSN